MARIRSRREREEAAGRRDVVHGWRRSSLAKQENGLKGHNFRRGKHGKREDGTENSMEGTRTSAMAQFRRGAKLSGSDVAAKL